MTSNANNFQQFLEDFRETITGATDRLGLITDEESRRRPSSDQWSAIEIVGHLIDSAANNHQRFVRAQFTEDLVFPGYDQDGWVNSQKYRERSWFDVVQLWSAYNLHLLHVVSVIPEETLTKTRERHNLDQIAFKTVSPSESTTLEYFIRDYVDHLNHHLDQIFS